MSEIGDEDADFQRVQEGLQATTTSSTRGETERLTQLLSVTGIYLPKDEDLIRQALSYQKQGDGRLLLRWVVARLECLQRLDCLQGVQILIQEGGSHRVDKYRMLLYGYLRRKGVVGVAIECALSGSLETVGRLLQLYPYTLMPRIMDVLQRAPESISSKYVLSVLTIVMEARRFSPSGPPVQREADVVECEAVCGLLRSASTSDVVCTERMAKLNYGWCCPTNHEIESWIVYRALEVERVTGLYLDGRALLDMGINLLGQEEDMVKDSMILKDNIVSKEYEVYILLCDEMERSDMLPCTMIDFVSASVEQRIESVVALCLETDGDLSYFRNQYIQPFMSLQTQLDNVEDVKALDALHTVLVGHSSISLPCVLEFLMLEFSQSFHILDMSSIVHICCEIILSDVGAGDYNMEFLGVAQAALEQTSDSSLMDEVNDIENYISISSLLEKMGSVMTVADVSRLTPQAWFDTLRGIIETKASVGVSIGQWRTLRNHMDSIFAIIKLVSQYMDKLNELYCQFSLKLGFLHEAEQYLGTISESAREELILTVAQDLVYTMDESDGSTKSAIKVLGLLPESQKARHEIEFIDTITKLQELGIVLSAAQLRKSSKTSQMFYSAVHNVKSTEGLQDIERVIQLSSSLNTGFSREEILKQLAETAFRFQDAPLCEKICMELVQTGSRDGLATIIKVVESDLEMRQETRSRLVSFALIGADAKSLLDLLGDLRKARGADRKCILADIMGENNGVFMAGRMSVLDERTVTIQIFSALGALNSDCLCDWIESFRDRASDFDRAIARSVYVGAIAAASFKAIRLALAEADRNTLDEIALPTSIEQLLHIDIAALCFLGCKCITALMHCEKETGVLQRLASIMDHAGSSLVATSDENRVALLQDKNAQDLWATGDVHAQRSAVFQLTDKIAASQISRYGVITALTPMFSEDTMTEASRPDLSDVYLLAERCGANLDQVEDVFVKGVLYRHGSTDAFRDSWYKICTHRPLSGLKIALSFAVEVNDMSNLEVVRVTEMIAQCLHFLSSYNNPMGEIAPVINNIYDIAIPYVEKEWLDLRILLLPVFQVLVACDLPGELAESQTCSTSDWVISIASESNSHDLFNLISKLTLEYRALRGTVVPEALRVPIDYPVPATVPICSALLKSTVKSPQEKTASLTEAELLKMLDIVSKINFGLLLVNPTASQTTVHPGLQELAGSLDEDALHRMLNIIVDSIRHEEAHDGQIQGLKEELLYQNALIILCRELSPLHISEDILTEIASTVVSPANADEIILQIQSTLQPLVYIGWGCNSEIGEIVSLVVTLCDHPSINAETIVTGMYLDSLETCLSALESESNTKDGISRGEAIQNIFGIVRSLDGNSVSGKKVVVDSKILRSAVYDRIGNYLANFHSHKDIIKSEIQIQLVEMMASLGKDKWNDWEPPSTGFDWSLQGESLLHSRLFSHFSTDWPDALDSSSISPEDLVSVDSVNEAFIAMAKNASSPQEVLSLWTAISSIILPHFVDTDNIELKFQDSYDAILKRIIELSDFDTLLSALDEYMGRFGQLGQELQESVMNSAEPKDQSLVRMMIGLDIQDLVAAPDDEFITGIQQVIQGTEVPDCHKLVAILLAIKHNAVAAMLDQENPTCLKDICSVISHASELRALLDCTSGESRETFKCPIRALVCSALVSQLLRKHCIDEASYVAFETLGLCQTLRVKDSGLPVIRAFLSRIKNIRWTGTYSDLANVLSIPICSVLAALTQDLPSQCTQTLIIE